MLPTTISRTTPLVALFRAIPILLVSLFRSCKVLWPSRGYQVEDDMMIQTLAVWMVERKSRTSYALCTVL